MEVDDNDELLVVRAQLGERPAIAALVRRWQEPVAAYVRRMLGPGRGDDVVQEVWVAVVRGLPKLRDGARFKQWLFTIARRAVADSLRGEYARSALTAERDPVLEDPGDAAVDRAELTAALADLPPVEREALVLFYLEDLSLRDCAEVCKVPVGTVKSRLNRGRRLLRERLEAKGFHP